MEFLVHLQFRLPDDMDGDVRTRLYDGELRRGLELRAEGRIAQIWRVTGTPDNVGIWVGSSAEEIERLVQTLPLAPWASMRITALEEHPLIRAER